MSSDNPLQTDESTSDNLPESDEDLDPGQVPLRIANTDQFINNATVATVMLSYDLLDKLSEKHLLQPGKTWTHLAARIVQRIRDSNAFGKGEHPDYVHVGWSKRSRYMFNNLFENGVDLDFRLVRYNLFTAQQYKDDKDLELYNDDPEWKFRKKTLDQLAVPGFDDYTSLHINHAFVVSLAEHPDGQRELSLFHSSDDDSTETINYPDSLGVTSIELSPDEDDDIINFEAIPDQEDIAASKEDAIDEDSSMNVDDFVQTNTGGRNSLADQIGDSPADSQPQLQK